MTTLTAADHLDLPLLVAAAAQLTADANEVKLTRQDFTSSQRWAYDILVAARNYGVDSRDPHGEALKLAVLVIEEALLVNFQVPQATKDRIVKSKPTWFDVRRT